MTMLEAQPPRSFDVICTGDPIWHAPTPHGAPRASLLDVTRTLARARLHVALATVLEDDAVGRSSRKELAALGIEVGAVTLASVTTDLVLVDASGGHSVLGTTAGHETANAIPASWSSRVLLLSGMSAITSTLAATCKAARRARRAGTVVVLDLIGSLRHWAGRDARIIAMVLREADVVRCSTMDLAVIGTDAASVRRAMRPQATLVINDENGTIALGAFGEVRASPPAPLPRTRMAAACTAAICAELARPSTHAETPSARWHRILAHQTPRLASA